MKTQVLNYTFNKTAKTVTFTDYATIRLDAILLIVNVTDQITIYNFADATKGGTVATNVLTLEYDTSAMDDADKLLIYYDDANYTVEGSTQDAAVVTDTTGTISGKLRGLVKILADVWDSANHFFNISQATKQAGEDIPIDVMKVEKRGSNIAISTATTTVVKNSSGHVNVLRCVGGTLGNVTVYDNAAASGAVLLPTVTPVQGGVLLEDIDFANGLTVVTAAATLITGSYR